MRTANTTGDNRLDRPILNPYEITYLETENDKSIGEQTEQVEKLTLRCQKLTEYEDTDDSQSQGNFLE